MNFYQNLSYGAFTYLSFIYNELTSCQLKKKPKIKTDFNLVALCNKLHRCSSLLVDAKDRKRVDTNYMFFFIPSAILLIALSNTVNERDVFHIMVNSVTTHCTQCLEIFNK